MKRVAIVFLLLLVMVPAAAIVFGSALLDSGAARARLAAAVERATGHRLRVDGPIRLAWSLTPAIEARQAALLNPAGFSQPDFASVERIEARIGLAALLSGRVEIASLTLEAPQLFLDRNADGRGNWEREAGPAPSEPTAEPGESRPAPTVTRLTIENGRVTWLGASLVTIDRVTVAGAVDGDVVVNGVAFKLSGQVAPNAHPVELTATGSGLQVTVSGEPGLAWRMRATAANLAAAGPLLGMTLPPLLDVKLGAQYGANGPSALQFSTGPSDLGSGLQLNHLEVTAPALDQPVRLVADLLRQSLPISVTLDVEKLSALLGPDPAPFLAVTTADGASARLEGTVTARSMTGLDATLVVRAADLQRLGFRAGLGLPKLQNVALDARLLSAPSAGGVLVRGLRLTARGLDLAGDIAIGTTPRPSIRGSLVSQTLDLAPWTMIQQPPPPPGNAPPPATPPSPDATPAPATAPERALPFDALLRADADLRISIGQALLFGAVVNAVEARVLLQDGKLRLDPFQATAFGQPVSGQMLADATAVPPTASLRFNATELQAAPLAEAFGAPTAVVGPVDVDVELRGAGADVRSMLASLDGHVGLALVDGEVDNRALLAAAGSILKAANVPVDAGARNKVRCLALRVDAAQGQLALRALALDAARLKLEGDGTVNLADGTLDLNLRPTLRIGATGVAVPVRLTGPITAPSAAMARGVIAPGRVGISIGGPTVDACPAALLAARGGRQGPLPQ